MIDEEGKIIEELDRKQRCGMSKVEYNQMILRIAGKVVRFLDEDEEAGTVKEIDLIAALNTAAGLITNVMGAKSAMLAMTKVFSNLGK